MSKMTLRDFCSALSALIDRNGDKPIIFYAGGCSHGLRRVLPVYLEDNSVCVDLDVWEISPSKK